MRSGIDFESLDPDVRPQDDLFAHVNGRWVAATPIPEDRGRYGTFDVLREAAEAHVREIIEEVAAGSPDAGTVAAASERELALADRADDVLATLGEHVPALPSRRHGDESHHHEGESDAEQHAEHDGDHGATVPESVRRDQIGAAQLV